MDVNSTVECPISFWAMRRSTPFFIKSVQNVWRRQYGTRSGAESAGSDLFRAFQRPLITSTVQLHMYPCEPLIRDLSDFSISLDKSSTMGMSLTAFTVFVPRKCRAFLPPISMMSDFRISLASEGRSPQ